LDRAGQEYWDALWEDETLPAPVDPRDKALSNYVARKFHELFTRVLPRGHNVRLLEVGCARSRWLPYFAAEYGYEVTGLDYSTMGCEQARQILAAAGVEGRIVEGDLFSPPEDLLEAFEVVVSFGLVEHFEDTAAATEALGRFLVPGGTLVTVIPNLGGSLIALIQRFVNRPVFDVHVPLDRRQLAEAHRAAGLDLRSCGYFLGVNWNVVNITTWQNATLRRQVMRGLSGMSKAAWWLEARGLRLRPNRLTSPYVVAIARSTKRITDARPVDHA
jgi:cyclopropane fatty-acyl-phospholipid synthase-like methyltransferase